MTHKYTLLLLTLFTFSKANMINDYSPSLVMGIGRSWSTSKDWSALIDIKAGLYIPWGSISAWHPTVGYQRNMYYGSPHRLTAGLGFFNYEWITYEFRADLVLGEYEGNMTTGIRTSASLGLLFIVSVEAAYQYHGDHQIQFLFCTDIPAAKRH